MIPENGTKIRIRVAPGRYANADSNDSNGLQKVGAIKGYRQLTDSSLKNAKDFIENVMEGNERVFELNITSRFECEFGVTYESVRERLLEAGFVIDPVSNKRARMANSLRNCAIDALKNGETVVAERLVTMLAEHYPDIDLEEL